MAEIDNLSIAISASASNASRDIGSLAQKLGGLKNRLNAASSAASKLNRELKKIGSEGNGVTEFTEKAKSVGETFNEMASSVVGAVGTAVKQIGRLGVAIARISFKTLVNGTKLVARGMMTLVNGVGGLAGALVRLAAGGIKLVAKGFISLAGNAVKLAAKGLMSFTSHVLKLVGALGRLAVSAAGAALSKLGGWAKSAAGGIASIVKQGTFLPLMFGKNLVQGIGGAIKGVGNLLKQFKRVVMYRALRSVIKEITQGFQDGLKNLYAWSRGVGGEFAASMNRIATATQYLRNSLGALASPLIESLAPAIDFVIDKFVALINIVNQFLARLSGKSTYIAAKKAAAQWDTASKHAGSAANAMKRYTLAFDELNILGKNSSSGGGGGSSSGTDTSGMFETRPIEGEVSSFADDIMAAFNTQDWARIGELLAGKFNEIIDSIPWPDIGDKIANGVNMAMGVAHSFLVETDFEGLGKDISDLFNHAVSNIDWDLMGRTAGEKFGAVLRTLTSLWEGIDFSVLGQRLSEAFNGYVDTVTTRISEIDWQWLGQKFSYGLNNLIGGIDWAALGDMLIAGFSSTIDLLLSAVETFDWVKAGNAVSTLFNKLWSYDWPGLVKRLKGAAKDVLDGLISTVSGFSWGDAKDTFYSTVAALFDANKFSTEPGGLGELLGGGINTAIESMKGALGLFSWGDAATTFATEVNKLISKVDWVGLGNTLKTLLSAAVTMLKNVTFSFEWGSAGANLASAINTLFDDPAIWADVSESFNNLLNGALDFTINFVENFKADDFAKNVKIALAGVDWPGIAAKVWELFAKAAIKLGNLITVFFGGEIKDQKPIENSATSVQEAINEKFAVRNYNEHGGVTSGTSVMDVLGVGVNTFNTVYDAIVKAYGELPWYQWGSDLRAWIKGNIIEADWDTIIPAVLDKIGEGLRTMALGLVEFLEGLFPGLEKILNPVKKALTYNTDPNVKSEALAGVRRELGWRAYGMSDDELQDLLDRSQPGVSPAVMDKDERERALAARDELANISNASRSDASIFTNVGSSFSNALSRGWNNIQQGTEQERYQRNVAKYTLLGGYYDVKEIGENIGQKIVDSPLGKLFSSASEQAKTERATMNQAQFLLAAGKDIKQVIKELDLNEKQTKKLVEATKTPYAIANGLGMYDYDFANYKQWANMKIPGFGKLSSETQTAIVDILFQPQDAPNTKYKNQGLIDYLKAIFAPGVDTKTRVELIKNGWKTLPEFVGTNKVLTAYTELVKKITGQTPATLFGATLSVLSWLSRKNNGETSGSFFGSVLSVLTWLTRKNNGETSGSFFGETLSVLSWLKKKYDNQTPATVFGSNLDITGNLKPGSTQPKDLYASAIDVLVRLKKDTNNRLKFDVISGGGTTINTLMVKKLGGAYHNGSWHDIPQYANGTVNAHGSLFLAGEAGPEIVGHVGGRTEVLNKSQLASAMFASVRAAMSPAVEMFRGLGNSFAAAADRAMNAAIGMADALYTQATGSYSGGYSASEAQSQDMDALLSLMRQESEATRQQNELLRQQNELLRQISEKDYSPSTSQLSRAFNRTNMRAGTTVIPVGT